MDMLERKGMREWVVRSLDYSRLHTKMNTLSRGAV